jgi:uncharacterized repeat protein (TIGR03803 family)
MIRLRTYRLGVVVAATFLISLTMDGPARATGALTTLVTFSSTQGDFSPSSLVEGSDGNYYGTTLSGGNALPDGSTLGTIFRMSPQGVMTTLHTFSVADGGGPTGLVLAPDGNFYGTTQGQGGGGVGTVFKVTTSGIFSVIYTFPAPGGTSLMGGLPTQLAVGSDGNLYGMTVYGGVNACGALFRMTLAGVPTVLYSFPQIGGSAVAGADPMTLGSDGYLYGVSNEGIFSVSPGGGYTLLHQFTGDQGSAQGLSVVRGSDGNLYGTTINGGANGVGSIYQLAGDVFTTLYSFPSSPRYVGIAPSSLIDGGDGYFYGTTSYGGQTTCACGQIFKISPSGTFASGYYFNGVTDTGNPSTRLVHGSDGYFYGSTPGSIYRFDSSAPPPPAISITTNPAAVALGNSATLTWNATNASSCVASNAWSSSVALQGSAIVTPTAQGELDYTLTCSGPGGTAVFTYTLQIDPPASATISIAPTTINIGQTAVLNWSGNNTCVMSGAWNSNVAPTGSQSISQSAGGSYLYTLTCQGIDGSGSATASATLTVNPPPVVQISASPQIAAPGQSYTLTWSSTNATSCVASNAWSGSISTSGTKAVTQPGAGTYTYALSCTGAGGATSNSVTVTVSTPPSPPTVTMSSNPSIITAGQSFGLSWSSTNTTQCSASGAWSGSVATKGTENLTPSGAGVSTYTLECTGPGGSANATTTVTVASAPTPPNSKGGGGGLGVAQLIGLGALIAMRTSRLSRKL